METYPAKQCEIENALDICGIGHDVQQRLTETLKRVAVLTADVNAAATGQALHDALTNRPHHITNSSIGKDDAERAFVSGIVHILGALVEWDIDGARQIAADILDDVNDHEKAAIVRQWAESND